MNQMELRDYQQTQVNFLKDFTSSNPTVLFDTNISLESPTGSGKSVVILEFIKQYFKHNKDGKIFVSTGFNNLVYQFYRDAINMGIPTKILIGKSNCTCIKKLNDSLSDNDKFGKGSFSERRNKFVIEDRSKFPKIDRVFEERSLYKPGENGCHKCADNNFKGECLYFKNKTAIDKSEQLLVITNHSTLIANQDFFSGKFIGGFIDECQSFGDFYESSMSIEINEWECNALLKTMEYDRELKNSLQKVLLETSIRNGSVTFPLLNKIMKLQLSTNEYCDIADKYPNISKKVEELQYITDAPDNYIYPQIRDGKFEGIKVDRFFEVIKLGVNCCIVSATVDKYTKEIFNVKEINSYKETGCDITDYKKSNVFIYDDFNDINIRRFLKSQYAEHGLLLSTRLDIVKEFKNRGSVEKYEVIDNPSEFTKGKKQLLVGSRSLFQGIDIENIGFVMINKLPFNKYDESYKKKMAFFESLGKNSYNYYTIPYTTNQLTQAMGRLWRKPGDHGNVAIFDGRCKDKHAGILRDSCSYRDGINIYNY